METNKVEKKDYIQGRIDALTELGDSTTDPIVKIIINLRIIMELIKKYGNK